MKSGEGQIKRSRQDRVWWSRERKEEEKEEKVQAHLRHVTFVTGKVIKRMLQASIRMDEEEGAICGVRHSKQCRGHRILMASYEDNTSQGKSWIFDSGSTVHVCFQKELFNNSLITKKEWIV